MVDNATINGTAEIIIGAETVGLTDIHKEKQP